MLRILGFLFFLVSSNTFAQEYKEPSDQNLKDAREMMNSFFKKVDSVIEKDELSIIEHKKALSEKGVNNNNFYNIEKIHNHKNEFDINSILNSNNFISEDYISKSNVKPLFIFVSFSMPDELIKSYLIQSDKLRSFVVVRGLYKDDFGLTIKKLKTIYNDQNKRMNLLIDPTLFQRFNITAVPSFVLSSEPVGDCNESSCSVPEHIKASGAITLEYFLDKVQISNNSKFKKIAENYLNHE